MPQAEFRLDWGFEIDSAHHEEIADGLENLASEQGEDGSWGSVAETALVVLAFLEANQTHMHGAYPIVVKAGLRSLKQRQGSDGRFGEPRSHALATLALTEAYRRTASPLFKQSARQGLDRILEDPDALRSPWAGLALKAAEGQNLGVPAKRVPAESSRWPPEDPAGTSAASTALTILGLIGRE